MSGIFNMQCVFSFVPVENDWIWNGYTYVIDTVTVKHDSMVETFENVIFNRMKVQYFILISTD